MSDSESIDWDTLGAAEWEAVYRSGRTPWDLGGTTPELLHWLKSGQLPPPPARALFPGSGRGYDPIAFARAGYKVTAVDFAPAAVEAMHARAAGHLSGQTKQNLQVIEADFFEFAADAKNTGAFDLLVEYTFFCAIDPRLRNDYGAACAGLLPGNAQLLGLFFPVEEREGGPPFGVSEASIREAFERHFDLTITRPRHSIKPRRGRELLVRGRRR